VAIDDIISGGQRNKREGGSRRSASRAVMFWSLALIAGASSAFLLKWYLDKRQALAPALSQIAVAAIDLPLATTLKAEHLQMVSWPKNARPPGTFGDPKELIGRVLVTRLVKSEPFMDSKLAAREAGGGLAALIPANMRAAAVRVDDVVGVAGFIHPEDRVDVLVTLRPQNGEPHAKVILQNVKVLAVGKQLDVDEKNKAKALAVTVATLLVTPEQSEKLALAANQGKLLLTLRSWTDADEVQTQGVVARDLLEGREERTAPVAEAPKPSEDRGSRRSRRSDKVAHAETPAAPKKDVVEILRGDRFEERKFEGQGREGQ
jgi:pilus assembly protein CpaB